MAIIKTTGLLSGIKGNMGGSSFYQGPYGNVMAIKGQRKRRKWAKELQEDGVTDQWVLAHACDDLQKSSGQWTTLTIGQKTTWDTLASTITWYNRFGDPYAPTGFLFFMQTSLNMKRIGLLAPVSAPIQKPTPIGWTIKINTLANGGPEIEIVKASDLVDYSIAVGVYKQWPGFAPAPHGPVASPPLSTLRRNSKALRELSPLVDLAKFDISDYWLQNYGSFPVGFQAVFWLDFIHRTSGQRFEGPVYFHTFI